MRQPSYPSRRTNANHVRDHQRNANSRPSHINGQGDMRKHARPCKRNIDYVRRSHRRHTQSDNAIQITPTRPITHAPPRQRLAPTKLRLRSFDTRSGPLD